MSVPVTKEKLVAFDGVLFKVYTQRFENKEEVYVGLQAQLMENPNFHHNFTANKLHEDKRIST